MARLCPPILGGQRQKHVSALNVELAIPPSAGFVWQESIKKDWRITAPILFKF
jgi:hypothetical protein